jgi:hypothetical protein
MDRARLMAVVVALAACGTSASEPGDVGPDATATDAGATDAGSEGDTSTPLPSRVECTDPAVLTPFPTGDAYAPLVLALSPAKYSYGRCELVALIVDAALDLHATMPEKLPFGVADLSQADGGLPGTDVGVPRHPAPSHTNGFSADITYLRLDGKTLEDSAACPSKTREFCEGDHDVDLVPTARLMAHLGRTKRIVQIIVDPKMEADIGGALDDLATANVDGASHARSVLVSGIPFHADHFHISVSRACYDGRDNDGDGTIDLEDPECVDALDDDEGT